MNTPSVARGIEEFANGTTFPFSNLPSLGPRTIAPANAAAPPAASVSYTHLTLPTTPYV